jgi:hypothetical protein
MTLDSDDLEELLRQNVNLRRQLGAQVAKAKDSDAVLYSPKTSKPAPWVAKRSATSVQDVVPPFETDGDSPPEPWSPFHRQRGGRPIGSTVGAAKTASDNNELEGFRRELTFRRLFAAKVPKAKDSRGNQSNERPPGSGEAAEAASDNEDLGELRRQLRLRRDLRAEISNAKDSSAKQGDRIAYSSGWVPYALSFPKIPSDLDSHRRTESSHY